MTENSREGVTNAVLLDSNTQTVRYSSHEHVHPVDHTNVNQYKQEVYVRTPNEPPPSYNAAIQSLSDPTYTKQLNDNIVENHSFVTQGRPLLSDNKWARISTNTHCSHCGLTGPTRVETSSTIITFLLAILLALFCCCFVFIPFCIPSCKKTIHYCSNCSAVLGEVQEFQ